MTETITHPVGANLWINKEAVRSATGWSDRTIRWKVQLKVLRSRNATPQNKKCGPSEYELSSLPIEAQLKFLKQPLLSRPTCTALALRSDPSQTNLFASLPEITEPERLNFSAEQNDQAMKRLEAIAPLLEFSSRSRRSRPTFRTVGGLAVRNMNSLADYLAAQHQISARTLWNWYAQYRKLGYAGLIDRVRSDKGKSRFFQAHPGVRAFVETSIFVNGSRFVWCIRRCFAIGEAWNPGIQDLQATAPSTPTCRSCQSRC